MTDTSAHYFDPTQDYEWVIPESPPVARIKDVSVYTNSRCNFDCDYCDRPVVEKLGAQQMKMRDVPDVVAYLKKVNYKMLSFHGGEPFQAIRVIDAILEEVYEQSPMVFIQTNGSMILKNEWFIEKWAGKLFISISYDFAFQEINRTRFDIEGTLRLLKKHNVGVQMQAVVPINRDDCFSMDSLKEMVHLNSIHRLQSLTLIPLQYSRYHGQYDIYIDKIPVGDVIRGFAQFAQALYVYGVNVGIMGYTEDFDRRYFKYTKQVVLSPDGYLYPDYGFLENHMKEARVGSWRGDIIYTKLVNAEKMVTHPTCEKCPMHDKCSLRYIYHWYETVLGGEHREPKTSHCIPFTLGLETIVKHLDILKSKPNLLEHIGYDNSHLYTDRTDTADDRL